MKRIANWNGYLDFLAIAKAGSISAAARELGLSQPTLSRRLSILETELGTKLLTRTPAGLILTPAGDRMLGTLDKVRDELEQAEVEIRGGDVALRGSVRITVTEALGIKWLAPAIGEFNKIFPHIRVEMVVANPILNLLNREADIAVRLLRPNQAELIIKRAGRFQIRLYASHGYVEQYGLPQNAADTKHARVVGLLGVTPTALLTEKVFPADNHIMLTNSLLGVYEAVRAGLGIGPVPDFVGDADPSLVRCMPKQSLQKHIWLTAVPELRESARLRAVYSFLCDHLSGDITMLAKEETKR